MRVNYKYVPTVSTRHSVHVCVFGQSRARGERRARLSLSQLPLARHAARPGLHTNLIIIINAYFINEQTGLDPPRKVTARRLNRERS